MERLDQQLMYLLTFHLVTARSMDRNRLQRRRRSCRRMQDVGRARRARSSGAGEVVSRAVPVFVRGDITDNLSTRGEQRCRRRRRQARPSNDHTTAGAGAEGRLQRRLPRPRHGDLALQGEAEEQEVSDRSIDISRQCHMAASDMP
jgi:hypothetical protein